MKFFKMFIMKFNSLFISIDCYIKNKIIFYINLIERNVFIY